MIGMGDCHPSSRARVRRLVAVSLASCWLFLTPSAGAEGGDKGAAVELLRRGDRHLAEGDAARAAGNEKGATREYSRALRSYERARETFPNPKINFPIAMAEQKLGLAADAMRHYRELLRDADELTPEVREQANQNIELLKAKLVGLRFELTPAGASVAIDGEDVAAPEAGEFFYVRPGGHTYTFTATGFAERKESFSAAAGTTKVLKVALEPRVRPVVGEIQKEDLPPRADRRMLWVVSGATATLALAASATGLAALAKHDAFRDPAVEADERSAAQAAGRRLALTADLLWVGAAAAGAVTGYLYMSRERDAEAEEARGGRIGWSATASAEGAGLVLGGVF